MPDKQKQKTRKHWERDLRKLETAYKDSEKKYWEFIDLVPLGIFEYNLEGIILQCNPFGLEMLGYTKEDLSKGIPVFSVVHPDQYELVKSRFARLFQGEHLEGEEFTAVMKNGNTFPVLLYSYPIFVEDKVVGVRGVAFDMTRSKKIEKQLQDILTRYEVMLKSLPDLIFRFDKDGRFVDYHANSPDSLALKPDAFMGKVIKEVPLPGDIGKTGLEKIKEALSLGKIVKDEYSIDDNGVILYFEARYIPIGTEEVQVIIRDITDMRVAQDTIRQIEAEKAVVLDSMTEMFAYFSPDMVIRWVNKAYADKFGVPQEALIGTKCHKFWNDLDRTCDNCPVVKAAQTGEPQEGVIKTQDGKFWHIRGYPVFDEDGKLSGLSEFCEDITFRKKSTEALKLTQFSVDQSADAAFWMGKDARFFYVNDTAVEALGYTREELLQMSVHDIDPMFPLDRWDEHWKDMQERKQFTVESIHRAKDGREFPVELMINYLEFDGQEFNCAFARDITDRKLNEKKLKEAKEKAEQANKTKSEFISNISHEIRTPLNSIIGFSEMLTSHLEDPKLKEYAGSIRSAGDSLLMLINDILDLSKIEAGRLDISLEPVEIRTVITEISQVFAVKVARKNLDFVVDVQDEVPVSLMLDKVRIRQVLFNLIGNAVKFTSKGYIRLIVNKKEYEAEKGMLGLEIRVEDSGVGIHRDSHESIFDSFVQLQNQMRQSTEGTGLGLSITKRLVEMMGGNISVESSPGEGSSFVINLKKVEIARDPLERLNGKETSYEVFKEKKVLLVDDSEINRMYVRDNLVDCGIDVKEVENGAEALEWVEDFNPDLILMDIMMPVMDGYEAILKLRANINTSNIPVLALTALAMRDDIEKIRASGFDDFLIKPFHIDELYEKMNTLLIGGTSKSKPKVIKKDANADRLYIEAVREAVSRIEKYYLPLWKQANELKEFKSIRMFADAIQAIGQELNIRLLVDYGDKLIMYCDNYDIEKIDSSLAIFPLYLTKMKEIETDDR